MFNKNDSISFELIESKRLLNFYLSEIEKFENNLSGLNRRSNNSEFSYRAEIMLSQLGVQTIIILKLKNRVINEEDCLAQRSNSEPVETATGLKTLRQDILRSDIYKSEKDFLKVINNYQKFLAKHREGDEKRTTLN